MATMVPMTKASTIDSMKSHLGLREVVVNVVSNRVTLLVSFCGIGAFWIYQVKINFKRESMMIDLFGEFYMNLAVGKVDFSFWSRKVLSTLRTRDKQPEIDEKRVLPSA
jgi:hypothetical protein